MHTKRKNALLNKSSLTNIISFLLIILGLLIPDPFRDPILNMGLFALSGAITNWLAVYMLFEKIPGLYGSGVVPTRFEEFKTAIENLVIKQFFNQVNIERFFSVKNTEQEILNFSKVIDEADLSIVFDALIKSIMDSPFGSILGMFGGESAVSGLKEPFEKKMKVVLQKITHSHVFQDMIRSKISSISTDSNIKEKLHSLVKKRLDELTPEMVKIIVQNMIQKHLGWLVVWGGVFGGLIGLITSFINFLPHFRNFG